MPSPTRGVNLTFTRHEPPHHTTPPGPSGPCFSSGSSLSLMASPPSGASPSLMASPLSGTTPSLASPHLTFPEEWHPGLHCLPRSGLGPRALPGSVPWSWDTQATYGPTRDHQGLVDWWLELRDHRSFLAHPLSEAHPSLAPSPLSLLGYVRSRLFTSGGLGLS
ncbi:hypothetical protein CsSME_00033579 [Camellia sinensis var. sinensis]